MVFNDRSGSRRRVWLRVPYAVHVGLQIPCGYTNGRVVGTGLGRLRRSGGGESDLSRLIRAKTCPARERRFLRIEQHSLCVGHGRRPKCQRLAISDIREAFLCSKPMCAAGRAVGGMWREVYGALGCSMFGRGLSWSATSVKRTAPHECIGTGKCVPSGV